MGSASLTCKGGGFKEAFVEGTGAFIFSLFSALASLSYTKTPSVQARMSILVLGEEAQDGIYGSLLAQAGTAEPQPLASSPPCLTANVKCPGASWCLYFSED